jgi:metal-responsive CopG/Arc/MetJ family transcriptional regulator
LRINAILPEDMVEKLDSIAKEEKKSRSRLFREATEKLIEERQSRLEEDRRKLRIKRSIEMQDKLRKKSGMWDGVSEIRKWREMAK